MRKLQKCAGFKEKFEKQLIREKFDKVFVGFLSNSVDFVLDKFDK